MQTATSLINATGLKRYYGKQAAVSGVDIQLQRGEILGLLGPNGAGKSTILQMLTGTLATHAGDIQINGIDLKEQPLQARKQIGYLPENPPLYRDMTIQEYLKYCAKLHGLSGTELKTAVDWAIERCDLETMKRRLISNLSKGYQQRVGIAQAILHKPPLIILDEPTVGLDPVQLAQIRQLIRELGEQHGIILSTHILQEVDAVCDRAQIINHGQTVLDETLASLKSRDQSLEQFFNHQLTGATDASHV